MLCGKAECGINRHIRKLAFKRLEELSFSYYDQTPVGFIISRMTSDTARLGETVAWGLVDLFWSAAYILITAVAMLLLNVRMALLVLSVMPVIAVVAVWFQKRILAGYREVRKTNSQITGAFNEGIMGAKTSKTLVREEANCEEFSVLTGKMRTSSIRAAVLSALFCPSSSRWAPSPRRWCCGAAARRCSAPGGWSPSARWRPSCSTPPASSSPSAPSPASSPTSRPARPRRSAW